MTDNVASLGFEVDSKPLDDAKQKLSDVATQADKTGQAVDKFNQTTAKTGDALRGGASAATGYAGPLGAIEAAARRAGLSVAEFQARTAAFRAETARLASSSGAAGTAIGAIAREAGAAAPGMAALGAASKATATEHAAHSVAATSLRGTLQGLNAVVGQFGGSLGGLVGLSGSARLGIVGLAAAVGGGFLTAIQRAGDEVERSKNRFAGLTGSAESGAKAYDAVRAAAKSSGVEFSAVANAVEKAQIGQDKFADRNVIYANTAERAAKQTKDLADAFGTVGSMLQGNLANAEEENKVLNELGETFKRTGTLTVDAFRAIQNESPSTAAAISGAFGYDKVQEFVKELGKAPITLDDFIRRMALVKPAIDTAMDPEKPKNLEQALRQLGERWNEFVRALADVGAFNAVKSVIEGLTAATYGLAAAFQAAANAKSVIGGGGQGGSSNATYDAMGNVTSSVGGPGPEGTGNSGGNDISAIDYGGVGDYLGDIPAFATGTDSAPGGLTRINEHGGEIVNLPSGSQVIPHDISMQMAGAIQGLTTLQAQTGIVSATPDPAQVATVKEITDAIDKSTIDISKKVLEGSDSIVNALNKLIGGVASTTVNPSTGLPVASTSAAGGLLGGQSLTGGGLGGSGGGGGFNTRGGGMGAEEAKAIAEYAKNNPPLTPQQAAQYAAMGAGMVGGQGSSIKGFGGSAARRFQSRQPYTGGRLPYGGGSLPAFANPYYGPLDGTDYGYGGYETGYATIGDGYDYGTSPYNDYGYSNYAGYDTGYTGGDFGVGGSSFGDVANQYMSSGGYDYTSGGWGNDTSSMDYGGGSVDYGYFAKGGQFKVGGDGGVDTTLATLHLTKGETVTITPEGVPLPSTPDSLSSPTAPSSDPSPSNTTNTTKNVIINVMPGIQADSFIKSRAQIARGI